MIEIEDVDYLAGERKLLDACTCTIRPGQLTAILGPNGAGKTTLLRTITGELSPHRGNIAIDGRSLDNWDTAMLARRRAVVSQFADMRFPFSVGEVVALGRAPHRRSDSRDRRRQAIASAMSRMKIAHLEHRIYATLSGGEKQRAAIARALAQIDFDCDPEPPRYLLLDEPTANLDLNHQYELMRLLAELADAGFGIAIVIHDLNLALNYATNAILMENGRIVANGSTNDVVNPANISSTFDVATTVIEVDAGQQAMVFSAAR